MGNLQNRFKTILLPLISLAILFHGAIACGDDLWQNPAGGSWTDGTNWSQGAPPTSGFPEFNLNTAGYTVTLPSDQNGFFLGVGTDVVTISLNSHKLTTLNITSGVNSTDVGNLTFLGPGTITTSLSQPSVFVNSLSQLTIDDATLNQGSGVGSSFRAANLTVKNGGQIVEGTLSSGITTTNTTLDSGTITYDEGFGATTLNMSNGSVIQPESGGSGSAGATTAILSGGSVINSNYNSSFTTLTINGSGLVSASKHTFSASTVTLNGGGVVGLTVNISNGLNFQLSTSSVKMLTQATFGGALDLTFPNNFTPAEGQNFAVFTSGNALNTPLNVAINSPFSSLQVPALPNGLFWNTSNLYTTGDVNIVPEPASMGLILVGGGLLARRRKSRKTRLVK